MNYSPEYAAIQSQFHVDRPDYGTSGIRYLDQISELAKKMGTRDLLDYGCGKATLQKNLPYPIQNYDPFIQEYSTPPYPADLVVCTDVMEHVESEFIDKTLEHIRILTKKVAFFQIATGPASKFLPDGRNAHLIQENINWWLRQMLPFFSIHHLTDVNSGFIVVCSPIA